MDKMNGFSTYKFYREAWISDREGELFIPLRVAVVLNHTSLQFLHG